MPEHPGDGPPVKKGLALRGLRQLLLPRPKDTESVGAAGVASLAVFGPAPETAAGKMGRDLVDFLRQVELFEELGNADLKRLAQIRTREELPGRRIHLRAGKAWSRAVPRA
jgi:hypothetical protein